MLSLPISLLVAHFIGDFVLQSDSMAIRKSKDLHWLTIHCLVYSLVFLVFGWKFWLITFYTHMATDLITSRITSKLWFFQLLGTNEYPAGYYVPIPHKRHWFFVAIGADQLIHYITLAITWRLLS